MQVALNDLIMLFAFAPIVVFLLGVSNIQVPWDTVALSVVLYIVIPLILQTFLIFFIACGLAKAGRVPHSVAAPGAMIGAGNFFELAVAAAIALFGLQSGAALATVVGVLVVVSGGLVVPGEAH